MPLIIFVMFFVLWNVLAVYSLLKFFILGNFKNIDLAYILAVSTVNMAIMRFFFHIASYGDREYLIMIVIFVCGYYSLYKGYRLLVSPRKKLKRRLTAEDISAIVIKKWETYLVIGVWIISFSASLVLIFFKQIFLSS